MDAVKVLVIWVDGSSSIEVIYINQLHEYVGDYKIIPHFECMLVCSSHDKDEINEAAMEVATEMGIHVGNLHGNVIVTGKRMINGRVSSINTIVSEDIVNHLEMRGVQA